MHKKGKYILSITLLIILGGSYIVNYLHNRYDLILTDKNMYFNIKYKGISGGNDFAIDLNGNYYIAYKNEIQFIGANGKSYKLLTDNTLNINSLEFLNNKLYFASNTSVFSFDLKERKLDELINDLPNFGDYKDSIIRLYGDDLYVSIGAATNSGVVGPDNKWLKTNTYNYDITPFSIIIKALKFGSENTGAFVPYKTRNMENHSIPGHFPGNSSIFKINIKTKELETFAWGIRNVKGMDFDSKGKLYASVGGMEDRGLRPIEYDFDYLFEIKKGLWYGWPDYSGGDPVNSPRFGKTRNAFIIEKPPTVNPPAPIYQNKYLSSLGTLTLDKKNDFGNLDSIFFYDQRLSSISELTKEGRIKEKIILSSRNDISSIKFYDGSLILLDRKAGDILEFRVSDKIKTKTVNGVQTGILCGIIITLLAGVFFIVKGLKYEKVK